MNNNQATLEKMERMGLWGMQRALRTALETPMPQRFTPDELVSHLVDAEWDQRQDRRLKRLLKAARFRYRAGIEDIDLTLARNLDRTLVARLADCSWIAEHRDVILTGPCGCGKSFIASALGQQACIHGYAVAYWSASKLFEYLKLCKADGSYLKELTRLAKRAVLVIDDFGLEMLDAPSRLSLLEILEDRHGRLSTMVASQLPVSQWHRIIGDPTLADAICDRIVHTAYRIELNGESVRKLYAQKDHDSGTSAS